MSNDRILAIGWILYSIAFFVYFLEYDPDAYPPIILFPVCAAVSTLGLLRGGVWARTIIRSISLFYLIISFLLLALWLYLLGYTGGRNYFEDPASLVFSALFVAGIGLSAYTLFTILNKPK